MADQKKKKKKKEKWLRRRHRVARNLAYLPFGIVAWTKYGVKVDRFREQGKRPYLILMNHQTAFDQFFVGMAFKGAVYYVASEDLFSNGLTSRALRFLCNPIPIKKQTSDMRAAMTCLRVAREGGTIAMAPEGNRTYAGRPCYIKPAVASLARSLKMPIAIFRIEGGFGIQPRWSDVVRHGKMHAYVSRVIEPEEYAKMSEDELYELLCTELYVDETKIEDRYRHKKLAEYLERVMYVCPDCGLSEFESHRDTFRCKKCGREARYLPDKTIEGIGSPFPYRYLADWYDAQNEYVRSLDPASFGDEAIYEDNVGFYRVIPYKKKIRLSKKAKLTIYRDRYEVTYGGETTVMPFSEVSAVTVLGRNKLNIYAGETLYQFKGEKRFNAIKYMNLFFHVKNVEKGDVHEILGL